MMKNSMETLPEEVLYLVHVTKTDPKSIKELQPSEVNEYQFPGVFFSLITKYNKDNEFLYPGKNILIFSPKLLLQTNWHANLRDKQGFISENNTFYPWNFTELLTKIKEQPDNEILLMNEIVFHDPISMKYLCRNIKRPTIDQQIAKIKKGISGNYYLPNKRIQNSQPPHLTHEPFYCFPFEDIYDGVKENNWKPSSKKFYNMMYKMCINSTKKPPKKKQILKSLKRNLKKIHKTRKNQKLNLLYEFTTKK
jgi:hypothetical protein